MRTKLPLDLLKGFVVGGVLGAILAANLVIYDGVDRGYEATIPEIFDESVVLGFVVVTILLAGPVLGMIVARSRRAKARRP